MTSATEPEHESSSMHRRAREEISSVYATLMEGLALLDHHSGTTHAIARMLCASFSMIDCSEDAIPRVDAVISAISKLPSLFCSPTIDDHSSDKLTRVFERLRQVSMRKLESAVSSDSPVLTPGWRDATERILKKAGYTLEAIINTVSVIIIRFLSSSLSSAVGSNPQCRSNDIYRGYLHFTRQDRLRTQRSRYLQHSVHPPPSCVLTSEFGSPHRCYHHACRLYTLHLWRTS